MGGLIGEGSTHHPSPPTHTPLQPRHGYPYYIITFPTQLLHMGMFGGGGGGGVGVLCVCGGGGGVVGDTFF